MIAGNRVDLSEVAFLLATVCGMLLMAPSQLKRTSGILYLILVFASAVMLIAIRVHRGKCPWFSFDDDDDDCPLILHQKSTMHSMLVALRVDGV